MRAKETTLEYDGEDEDTDPDMPETPTQPVHCKKYNSCFKKKNLVLRKYFLI